jgi:hypothetical protein
MLAAGLHEVGRDLIETLGSSHAAFTRLYEP